MRIDARWLVCGVLGLCLSPSWAGAADIEKALAQGQFAEALQQVEAQLRLEPDSAEVRFQHGVALTMLGREADAIGIFRSLVDAYPGLPEPANNLAVIHARRGELLPAQKLLEQLLEVTPDYGPAHENLGDVLVARATEAYRRADELGVTGDVLMRKLRMVHQLGAAADRPAQQLPDVPAESSAEAMPLGEIMLAMQTWRSAWEAADLGRYLATYSHAYKAEQPGQRQRWERYRQERLQANRNIAIELADLEFTALQDDKISVRFHQRYRSDTYRDQVLKRLDWIREDGRWRIVGEEVL